MNKKNDFDEKYSLVSFLEYENGDSYTFLTNSIDIFDLFKRFLLWTAVYDGKLNSTILFDNLTKKLTNELKNNISTNSKTNFYTYVDKMIINNLIVSVSIQKLKNIKNIKRKTPSLTCILNISIKDIPNSLKQFSFVSTKCEYLHKGIC